MKKLFISDIDDTLVKNGETISKDLSNELNKIIKNNINFTLCTARSYENVKKRFSKVTFKLPIICRSGAVIYNQRGEIIYYTNIRRIEYLVNGILECNLVPIICVIDNLQEKYYTLNTKENSEFIKYSKNIKLNYLSINDLKKLKNVVCIYGFGKVRDNNINFNNVNCTDYVDFICLSSKKANKAIAVTWLKKHLKAKKTIIFGNDYNDYSMLDIADYPYIINDNNDKYNRLAFDYGKSITNIIKTMSLPKIMMVPSGYYPDCNGGVEIITQALAEGLVKRGYRIVVMCPSNTNAIEYISGVKVYKIKPKELSNNHNSRNIYKINRLLQMYNPLNKVIFNKIIKSEEPDIIHVHMVRTLSMSVFKVANKNKIPIISTLHEYFSLWNFNPFDSMDKMLETKPQWYVELIRKKHRKLTKKTSYITAPLNTTIKKYQAEGYYTGIEGVEIINALPSMDKSIRKINLNTKINKIKKDEKIKFLIISRLMPFKGIEKALESFSKTTNNNFELNIAGDGPLKSLVDDYTKKDSRIVYHGYVIGKKKEKLFEESNVLVFLTTELETFGLVITEAYEHNMPVITTNVEATRRIVKDNETGQIVDSNNITDLVNAYEKYIDKKHLINQMQNCYEYLETFNFDVFINRYIKVYERVKNNDSI